MNIEIYTCIGFTFVWCMKYIFIPFGVALSSKIVFDKMLRPQPEKSKRKKRS